MLSESKFCSLRHSVYKVNGKTNWERTHRTEMTSIFVEVGLRIHEGLHIQWWWFTLCNVKKNFDKYCFSCLTVAAVHHALGISPTGISLYISKGGSMGNSQAIVSFRFCTPCAKFKFLKYTD